MNNIKLPKLPADIEGKLIDVLSYLEDNTSLDHYEYTGLFTEDEKTPYLVTFGGKTLLEFEFHMTEKSNGDYDGYEGLSINYYLKEK